MIGGIFAHEGKPVEEDAPASRVVAPALAGDLKGVLSSLCIVHFCDREVRYVGPLFVKGERLAIQLGVQLFHTFGAMRNPDVNRTGGWDEGLQGGEGDFERIEAGAGLRQNLQGLGFGALQKARGKQSKVRGEIRQIGMKLPSQIVDKLYDGSIDICDQRISGAKHIHKKKL